MKRAAVTFFVVAALVSLLALMGSGEERDAANDVRRGPAAERAHEERAGEAESAPEASSSQRGEGTHSAHHEGSEGALGDLSEPGAPDPLPNPASLANLAPGEEAASAVEHSGPERFGNADSLAVRRARQIELVVRAMEQAEEALADAEESGDTARAATTRGILRRLQVRRDALERAASSSEPY